VGSDAIKPRGATLSLAAVLVGAALLSPCGASRVPEPDPQAISAIPQAELDELARIEALRKQGELDEAERLAAPFVGHASPSVRARAVGIIARVRLKQGRSEEAIEGLARAAELHREASEPEDAVRDLEALAYTGMVQGRRFAEARAALTQAEGLCGAASSALPSLRYYQGVLAYQTADLRSALRLLREAFQSSEALGQKEYRASALQLLALVLQLLGREEEGEALLLDAERKVGSDDCLRADVLANLAWLRLRSKHDPEGVAELFERSLALREGPCDDAHARAAVLTDYALLALREGRDAEARARLDRARRAVDAPAGALVTVWLDVEGQIALRGGKSTEALAIFDRLAELAEGGALPIAAWRAALGRARALAALGRLRDAGDAYERAETLVARSSLLVPADEGRAGFLGGLDESARAAIGFFLARDPARAVMFARRARARALSSLRWIERVSLLRGEERARWDAAMTAYRNGRAALEAQAGEYWKLTAPDLAKAIAARREAEATLTKHLDEQIASLFAGTIPGAVDSSPPAARELILVYSPMDRGVAGFAVTTEGTQGEALSAVDPKASPAALSDALLRPFSEAIARAERVRFVVAGPLDGIDFHALPWDGAEPLLAKLPVAYGVDSGGAIGRRPEGSALVIGDPRGDLPATRAESKSVSGALRAAGFDVRELFGEAATYGAVRDAIEAHPPGLLHYAGHGSFDGAEGWGSRLRLAEGSELSVGDVLSLRAAPVVVVLSGCETGRTPSGKPASGLGLGHAFLVAGSRAVIAAARPIDDALAAQIMGDLYLDAGSPEALFESLPQRLRAAELRARAARPWGDWANFRLLVP